MSHTFIATTSTFIYDANYEGSVEIVRASGRFLVPIKDIVDFVAAYVRDKRFEKLEQASSDEILGI